jgi:hypothetical protein
LFIRWADLTGRTPPVALILSGVRFTSNLDKNLLSEAIIIAQVISTPTIINSNNVIYTSATNELRINGTGFIGTKKIIYIFLHHYIKKLIMK